MSSKKLVETESFVPLGKDGAEDDHSDFSSEGEFEDDDFSPLGIVYIGHIPHGFFEKQIHGYLSQFGDVKDIVVSRSRKTGKSRGYGFVQFEDPIVARIAAETLNGYPLADRVLKAHVVEPEKTHPGMFRHANRAWRKIPWRNVRRQFEEVPVSEEAAHLRLQKLVERERLQEEKWKALGIDYEFENSYEKQLMEMSSEEETDDESGEEEVEHAKKAAAVNKKRTRNLDAEDEAPSKKPKSSAPTNTDKVEMTEPAKSKAPKKNKNAQAKAEAVKSKVSKSPKTAKSK